MALRVCVDCGTLLSYRAEACPKCRSKDPYGNQRENQKLVVFVLSIVILIFSMSWFSFQVLPFQLIIKCLQLWK